VEDQPYDKLDSIAEDAVEGIITRALEAADAARQSVPSEI
jgi:hypothetical protein